MRALPVVGAATLALGVAGAAAVPAQEVPARSVQDGVYTTAQAGRGEILYEEQCVSCHGPIRAIIPEMAALLGDHTFRARWRGRALGELFALIRDTMPQDAPGTLSPSESAEIVAYILSGHRLPAGETVLPDDAEALVRIAFEP